VTVNASINIENVNVAINTPLPNAIIVVTNFCERLKKRDTRLPISKGHEAMKPNSSESTTPFEVRISDQVIIVWINKKFLITSIQSQSKFTKKFQIS